MSRALPSSNAQADTELRTAIQTLHADGRLTGLLIDEAGGLPFERARGYIHALWGPANTRIVPQSAERVPSLPTGESAQCLLLPNAHGHAPELLDQLLRALDAHAPRVTFVATYHSAEGSPRPMLIARAAMHLPLSTGVESLPTVRTGERVDFVATQASALRLAGHRAEAFALIFADARARMDDCGETAALRAAVRFTMAWRAPSSTGLEREPETVPKNGPDHARTDQARPQAGDAGGGDNDRESADTQSSVDTPGHSSRDGAPIDPAPGGEDAGSGAIDPDGAAQSQRAGDTMQTGVESTQLPPGWSLRDRPAERRRNTSNDAIPMRHAPRGRGRRYRPSAEMRVTAGGAPRLSLRRTPGARIHWAASIAEALKWQRTRPKGPSGAAVTLARTDLRFVVPRAKRVPLYIVLLDTSGSMAKYHIERAKGLTSALARESSLDGSRIALITCGGTVARTLVAPTAAPPRVEKALAALRVGGGTPILEGLQRAGHVAFRHSPPRRGLVRVICFTDGGVHLAGPAEPTHLEAAVTRAAARLMQHGATFCVVDTRPKFAPGGHASAIAHILQATYIPLARLQPTPQ